MLNSISRMKRTNSILKKIVLGILLNSNLLAQDKLTLMTENWPPLNYVENNIVKGPAVDIVKAIQSKINDTSQIEILPWKRAYLYISKQTNTVLFSMVYSHNRKNEFKWVGPIAEKRYSLYAKKDFNHTVTSLDEAREFTIGVQRSGFTQEYLQSKGFKDLDEANSPFQNVRKLIRNRFDLIFESYSTYLNTINKYELNKSDFKEVLVVKKSLLYIAFNKKTDNSIIQSWQKAYDELYEKGMIKEIYQHHGSQGLYWNKSSSHNLMLKIDEEKN